MAITLLHGPAGAGKTRAILKKLASLPLESFKVILPGEELIQYYQREWIALSCSEGAFLESSFLTFDDFLLKLLKINEPRVHKVDSLFVKNVLRKIIHESPNNLFRSCLEYSEHINELSQVITRLCQCGLNAYRARQFFKTTPELMPLVNILRDYEVQMQGLHAYDTGLLTTSLISRLDQDDFQWFPKVNVLVVDRIFPLGPGQRETLFRLSQKRPELEIIVSYAMDYDGAENPHLYHSYTSLGEIAGREEYFHYTKNPSPILAQSHMHPADELEDATADIEGLLRQGVSPADITVVLPPNANYHHRLNYLMEARGIPHAGCQLAVEENSLQPALEHLISQWQRQAPTGSLLHQLNAVGAFESQWAFTKSLLFESSIPDDVTERWAAQEREHLTYKIATHQKGIQILSLPEASALDTRHLFILGFSQEAILAHIHENRLFPMDHLTQPEMMEAFGGPRYRVGLLQKNWQDLIKRNQGRVYLSYSRHDWSGREQNPPGLFLYGTDIKFKDLEPRIEMGDEATAQKILPRFPLSRQNTFSISEIETYFKCPFQYYARYQLKLEEWEEPSPDIRGDVSGRLIHRALDKLYGENLDLYQEACDYDLYLTRFKALIPDLVSQLALNDVHIKRSPRVIIEDYIRRASSSLIRLVDYEINLIRKGDKTTRPYIFEWAFGKGHVPPLRLSLEDGEIYVTGRIDRVDVDREKGIFSVIDYKTGELPTGVAIREGTSPQVPLYMMVVQQHLLPDMLPASGLLIGLKEIGKNAGLVIEGTPEEKILWRTNKVTTSQWDEIQDKIRLKVAEAARKINDGRYQPEPLSPSECERCGYVRICHYKPGDNKETLASE